MASAEETAQLTRRKLVLLSLINKYVGVLTTFSRAGYYFLVLHAVKSFDASAPNTKLIVRYQYTKGPPALSNLKLYSRSNPGES